MQFMGALYVGETLISKEHEIVKKVHNKQLVPNLYLLTFSNNADNMLDMIPEWEALQKNYPSDGLKIVGIANGKKEAIQLLQVIISESIAENGNPDIREFLKRKWEGQACR